MDLTENLKNNSISHPNPDGMPCSCPADGGFVCKVENLKHNSKVRLLFNIKGLWGNMWFIYVTVTAWFKSPKPAKWHLFVREHVVYFCNGYGLISISETCKMTLVRCVKWAQQTMQRRTICPSSSLPPSESRFWTTSPAAAEAAKFQTFSRPRRRLPLSHLQTKEFSVSYWI